MGTLTRPIFTSNQQMSRTNRNFVDSGTPSFIGQNEIFDYPTFRRKEVTPKKKLSSLPLRHLDEAFYWITDAADPDVDSIERSNLFDSWKDSLVHTIKTKAVLSISQHEILGSLLVAVKNKDVADFDNETLSVFLEATNYLRQNRVLDVDSKRIVDRLLDAGLSLTIPLTTDTISQNDEEELDCLMETLLEKSRETD